MDLAAIASCVSYVGSPEHKDAPSFAGWPAPRADATICDRSWRDRQTEITGLLQQAILAGSVGSPWEGPRPYPRYVWAVVSGEVFEARLVNSETGQYKGYGLAPEERPGWL